MIVEGGKKYSVKLIPQTCNSEDAVREIVNALDHLNAISDEIFSTIKIRLGNHRKQVESLSRRVEVASDQVSNLKGSQKAIRIISPAKYPCEPPNPSADNILGQMACQTLVANNVILPPSIAEEHEDARCQRPLRFDSSIKHPNDLLSIFHVKEPKVGDLNQLDNVADVGLGKPPLTIRNMDSFFLFNTIDNPYTNYKMTERSQDRNFGTLKPTRKGEEVHGEVCPAIPPENNATEEKKSDIDDFYYYPSTVEIPNIDVPESLPDLPGIADTFDLNDQPFSLSFPAKPPIEKASPQIFETVTSKAPNELNIPEVTGTIAQNVPSQSPPASSVITVNQTHIHAASVVPPPPPPPPPQILEKEEKPVSYASSSGGDLRSSLMAAIREAGGSGKAILKSAKDRKYEAKKKKQDEKEKNVSSELEGGDLMADLKNKLAMRRKGISGIQDGQKRAAVGDIMLSLASAIPTMDSSVEALGEASDGDEEDWD